MEMEQELRNEGDEAAVTKRGTEGMEVKT